MKNWYSIKNKSSSVLEVSLHDEIGLWGVTAKDFIADLRSHEGIKSINLSVHSPGGSTTDGFAMYNVLKNHPAKVFGRVEGLAASAASFVLMASDVIEMPENSYMMIHNAWGLVIGDVEEMRGYADVMEKIQNSIISIYADRTGMERNEIAEMMSVETWMNGKEAVEKGFADTITDAMEIAAKVSQFSKHFKEVPISNETDVSTIESITDYEKCLRDSGLSRGLATALTSRAKVVFQSDPEPPDDAMAQVSERLDKLRIL